MDSWAIRLRGTFGMQKMELLICDAQNLFDEITIIGFKYRKIKSSRLQSIERGRRTEIDFLNGYICDRGLNVPTPVNDAVRAMVLEIEEGKRKISLDNINELLLVKR